mmetsp:Transcript_17097/g.42857  ORF Transcript_17097/g.42857 Transcript_17097/m.42857 type:complete len:258 (+) Transcript_17097:3857-4630(+)
MSGGLPAVTARGPPGVTVLSAPLPPGRVRGWGGTPRMLADSCLVAAWMSPSMPGAFRADRAFRVGPRVGRWKSWICTMGALSRMYLEARGGLGESSTTHPRTVLYRYRQRGSSGPSAASWLDSCCCSDAVAAVHSAPSAPVSCTPHAWYAAASFATARGSRELLSLLLAAGAGAGAAARAPPGPATGAAAGAGRAGGWNDAAATRALMARITAACGLWRAAASDHAAVARSCRGIVGARFASSAASTDMLSSAAPAP